MADASGSSPLNPWEATRDACSSGAKRFALASLFSSVYARIRPALWETTSGGELLANPTMAA